MIKRFARAAAVAAALAGLLSFAVVTAGAAVEASAAVPQMGPAGPVWVDGALNYDSVNGQTFLAGLNQYEQAAEAAEQAAIPNNDWPITYVAVAPWVTALPSGVIGFKLTLGYENAAGKVVAFNQYEGQAFIDVHDLPAPANAAVAHAEAVLVNDWAHWPA